MKIPYFDTYLRVPLLFNITEKKINLILTLDANEWADRIKMDDQVDVIIGLINIY